ncbi:MAG: cytidine/deoxycytidylate deaminase family protein [Thermodesulfobacteriota bacterium]|nr:cytidine/deoxycytidylate deaminase family protein [Thermodesulfobacteriota bacterium]
MKEHTGPVLFVVAHFLVFEGKRAVMERISWNRYFVEITRLIAQRSTCVEEKMGATIVKDRRILTTGYSGAPKGLAHCLDIGCLREKMRIAKGEKIEICRGLHAIQNALIQAAIFGVKIGDSTIYTTHPPCILCAKMLINIGIEKIVIIEGIPQGLARDLLEEGKIDIKSCP